MAKNDKGGKGTSKTNVTARQAEKAKVVLCRVCGTPPNVVRRLNPGGKAEMYRKCCEAAGIAA